MAIGSGMSAQFGYASEGTWGTVATPDHFLEFDSESLAYDPTWLFAQGIKSGRIVSPAARATVSRYAAGGDVTLDFAYNKMGGLIKQALGSSASATLLTGTAYKQVHQLGDTTGKSLTLQVGRPQPDATVKPFTYPGSKFTAWSIGVSDNDFCKFTATVDAKDEQTSTGLATAAYIAGSGVFDFNDCVIKLGGTASTTTGVVSIAGGTTATTLFNSFNLSGTLPHATERYGLGNAGAKAQQILNGLAELEVTLGGEFTSQAEIYDVFKAQTTTALQVTFTGSLIGGSNFYLLDIVIPATKIITAGPQVNGTDIVNQDVTLRVLDDGTNNACQITLVSTDTTL